MVQIKVYPVKISTDNSSETDREMVRRNEIMWKFIFSYGEMTVIRLFLHSYSHFNDLYHGNIFYGHIGVRSFFPKKAVGNPKKKVFVMLGPGGWYSEFF